MALRYRFALLLFVVGLPCVLPAQQGQDCRQRTVPVNVLDKEGNQVWGLRAADFRAEFRSQPVKIVSAPPGLHCRIVLLLDVSGSMTGPEGKWELARQIAGDVITYVSSQCSIALVLFARDVKAIVGFEAGRQGVLEALATVETGSLQLGKEGKRTALWDAVMEALTLFDARGATDAVFVITDGDDTDSRFTSSELEEALLSATVRLFTVRFEASGRTPQVFQEAQRVSRMAAATGGNSLYLSATGVLTRRFELTQKDRLDAEAYIQMMCRQMAEFYRLELELPREVDKPRTWKLEVVDARGKKRKELTVVYPRKLVPCAAEGTED